MAKGQAQAHAQGVPASWPASQPARLGFSQAQARQSVQAQAEAHAWPMSKAKPRLTWTQIPAQPGQTQLGLLDQSAPKPKSKPRLDPSANTSPASEALLVSAMPMGVESIRAQIVLEFLPTALAQIVLGWAHDGLNVDNG